MHLWRLVVFYSEYKKTLNFEITSVLKLNVKQPSELQSSLYPRKNRDNIPFATTIYLGVLRYEFIALTLPNGEAAHRHSKGAHSVAVMSLEQRYH
jgi:hypothetical protein